MRGSSAVDGWWATDARGRKYRFVVEPVAAAGPERDDHAHRPLRQSCAAASAAPNSNAAEAASRRRRVSISVPPLARGGEPRMRSHRYDMADVSLFKFLIQASSRAGHELRTAAMRL
jgi:hypothetical protein